MSTTTPTMDHVNISRNLEMGGFSVTPHWAGVDRPETHGWLVRTAQQARRLAQAVQDGAVYYDVHVATDVNGQTYVATTSRVMGRRLNADLKRLGY